MARKGVKKRTRGPGPRSNRTKARARVNPVRESRAELEKKLAEALEQQAATSQVLKVISSSPGDLGPVFETILAEATRLCEAKFGVLWLCEDDGFRSVALHGVPAAYARERARNPFVRPSQDTAVGRVGRTRRVVHVDDLKATMKMGQPFPGVWLPASLDFEAGVTLAVGRVDLHYGLEYHDYRRADVTTKVGVR